MYLKNVLKSLIEDKEVYVRLAVEYNYIILFENMWNIYVFNIFQDLCL